MAGSLQDQLLGKGLIKKQDAKNIHTAKKKAVQQSRKNNTELVNEASELAKKAEQQQRNKSQALNEKQKDEAQRKALLAQIRQIIELNSIHKSPKKMSQDELSGYNFTDNNKIKTLYISPQNHDLVSHGRIAIAKLHDSNAETYHLIPADAANKISERDKESIVVLNDRLAENDHDNSADGSDDLYAEFKVPDDLMW